MKRKHILAINVALLSVCLLAVKANAFKFPKIPKIPGTNAGIKIPGVDALLKREPTLTTSLADVAPEIPYLDDYNPGEFAPLIEVPRDTQTHYLRYPGLYEFVAQSYCLHAGSYGPRSGNGYLYAPLKGRRADVINDILSNSVRHPEVPQKDIQLLVWGVLAESKVSTMSPNLQEAAEKLLTKKQISSLNGGALGQIPPEVRSKLLPQLPPLARMAFDAENSLRGMLSQQTLPAFQEVERVAVLTGDPPANLRDPSKEKEVPSGRWSYHPNGYFIRMFPSSYYRTKVQIYEPEQFDIQHDDKGRIIGLSDPRGNRIEISYADTAPLRVEGDAGLQGWAFSEVRFVSTGDAAHPGLNREKVWANTGWTWAGNGTGDGQLSPVAPYQNAANRYASVRQYHLQMAELDENLTRNKYMLSAADSSGRIALSDLAHLRSALQELTANVAAKDQWAAGQVSVIARAWQSALRDDVELSRKAAEKPAGAQVKLAEFRYARQLQQFDGGGSYGSGSGFGGGGAGMPGSSGRQRLAQSSRPAKDKSSRAPDSIDKAKRLTDMMGNVNDGITLVTSGPTGVAGGFLPGKAFGEILDFIYDKGRKITDALSMDPPRDDFRSFEAPPRLTVPQVKPSQTVSAQRAKAWNDVMEASITMHANLQAAHIAVDRHGGALLAGDDQWVYNQGAAIVHFKKEVGVSMIELADRLNEVVRISVEEKISDPQFTTEMMQAYMQRLQTQGFSAEEKEAARIAGLTDEELELIRQERTAALPDRISGKKFRTLLTEMAVQLRIFGAHLNALPPVALPKTPQDNAKQAKTILQ